MPMKCRYMQNMIHYLYIFRTCLRDHQPVDHIIIDNSLASIWSPEKKSISDDLFPKIDLATRLT